MTPCRYSRFVFFSGAGISLVLMIAGLLLWLLSPHAPSTTGQLVYIATGKSCVESSFAALVCALIAAAIGEAIFRNRPE